MTCSRFLAPAAASKSSASLRNVARSPAGAVSDVIVVDAVQPAHTTTANTTIIRFMSSSSNWNYG
jgi:hypothetical protein